MTFQITRTDGRSNAQVIIDLVCNQEPGRLYTFREIADALGAGSNKVYTVPDVRGAWRGHMSGCSMSTSGPSTAYAAWGIV